MRNPPPPDDGAIVGYLDDSWRTPLAVQRLMKGRGAGHQLADVLERLSLAGLIEASAKLTKVPKFHHRQSSLSIRFYRKLQV